MYFMACALFCDLRIGGLMNQTGRATINQLRRKLPAIPEDRACIGRRCKILSVLESSKLIQFCGTFCRPNLDDSAYVALAGDGDDSQPGRARF